MACPLGSGAVAALPVKAEAIPDLLKGLPRWVVWMAVPKADGGMKKIPCDANGRFLTDYFNPLKHRSFDEVLAAYKSGVGHGIGLVMTGEPVGHAGDGAPLYLVGVDLDKIDASDEKKAAAKEIWFGLGKPYRERSPGGKGLRMFALSRHKPHSGLSSYGELYAEGRFLTVTGQAARGEVRDATDGIRVLGEKWFPAKTGQKNVVQFPREFMEINRLLAGDNWPETEDRIAQVRALLAAVPADTEYDVWRNCAWAVASLEWHCGRDLVKEWSRSSEAHCAHDDGAEAGIAIDVLFDSYDPSRGVSVGTLVHHAKEYRWAGAPQAALSFAPQGHAKRFTLLSRADLDALPPLRWIIDSVLPESGLAAIYGEPGSGKTFLAIDLAARISSGAGNWFGRNVSQRPVVYMALEGGRGIRQRLAAWDLHNGFKAEKIRVLLGALQLQDATAVDALIAALTEQCASGTVVIIDTLAQATLGADENSGLDMGNALGVAQSIAAALNGLVIFVHHSGKDASRGLRGHSSLNAAMDAVIAVHRNRLSGVRDWNVSKMKDGDDTAAGTFTLTSVVVAVDENEKEVVSCAVEEALPSAATASKLAAPSGKNAKAVLDALMAHPNMSKGWTTENAETIAKNALPEVGSVHRASRAKAALAALVKGGYIKKTEGGYHPP